MVQEPGNMVGPTNQGIDDLMAQDPNAYWDDARSASSARFGQSPRVFPIPLYDPDVYRTARRTAATRTWCRELGRLFRRGPQGNEVYGRIVPITGVIDDNAGPAPDGVFPRAIRLVK